jgi:hypothetical protein
MKYPIYNHLIRIALALCVCLWIGCQASTLNIGDIGTSENPLEKSGTLTKSEVWSGNIFITGNVIVPEGVTLTIRSRSIVGFEPTIGAAHQLIVRGTLYAEGEPDGFIILGSLGSDAGPPKAGDWEGILFTETSLNSRLTYCRIQHARGIICRSNLIQLEHCWLSDNDLAILCDNVSPFISQNEINRNGTAIKCLKGASPEITRNAIRANKFGIVCDDDSRPMIHLNEISSNYQHAIVCYSTASPEITSNNIILNGGWAVYDGGRLRDNFIRGNNERGPDVIDRGTGRDSGQFYGVDEVLDPRASPVPNAGVEREGY